MFGKKKDKQTQDKSQHPREILKNKITQEVEALTAGQAVIYQLPEFFTFARFLGVELNPTFPQKGKKYCLFTHTGMADGKPAGEKQIMNYTNSVSEYGEWVADKYTEKWGIPKRFQ